MPPSVLSIDVPLPPLYYRCRSIAGLPAPGWLRLWRGGARGAAAAQRVKRAAEERRPIGRLPRTAALPAAGQERHLPLHGRRAVAGRHVRSQAAADTRARPAVRDEDRADAVQQQRQHARLARGSSSSTAQSGMPVSDLFPHVARHVDDLAVIRSMTRNFPEHTNANYFLHTGSGMQGRPSMGAWVSYGLGSECQQPARLRRPQRRPDSARRARQLQQRLSARRPIRARSSAPAIRRSPTSRRPKPTDELQREQARPAASSSTRQSLDRAGPRRRSSSRPSPTTSWPSACRRPCPS